MKKLFVFLFVFLMPALGGGAYIAHDKASSLILQKAQQVFTNLGFNEVQLSAPQVKTHQALFSNIKLDKEGFSEIKHILIEYDPITLLTEEKMQAIRIVGATLTGEIKNATSANTTFGIAGWSKDTINPLSLNQGSTLVELRNCSLTLLTEEFGGIEIKSDLQLRPTAETTDIKGHLDTRQKHFGFDSKISGFLTSPDLWEIDFEINAGRIKLETLSSSRISGNTKITYTPAEGLNIVSKLDAGGLSLLDTPWQNASSTIEYQNGQASVFLGAKSIGVQGMELSLQYQPEETPGWTGAINAPNIKTFLTYMDAQNLTFSRDKTFNKLGNIDNVEIQFALPKQNSDFVTYNIINYEKNIDVTGKIKIK